METDYLIVHRSVLPDYIDKILKAKHLLDSHQCRSISDAVQRVGISRSTFYKYKDRVYEPAKESGWKFTLALYLMDTQGILSDVLVRLRQHGTSIVTIHQDIPINHIAHVMITLEGLGLDLSVNALILELKRLEGIQDVKLVAMG